MNLLLVAATVPEIQNLLPDKHSVKILAGSAFVDIPERPGVSILITGPGILATTFFLTRALEKDKFDLVINAGIAGSFRDDLPIGAAVNVVSDCFPEMGAEHKDKIIPLYGMEMARPYLPAFMNEASEIGNSGFPDLPSLRCLPSVKGITVNTITGSDDRVAALIHRTGAEVESMEGAAVFYCCHSFGIPCLQIRTISNLIKPGHLSLWNISLAISQLHSTLIQILDEL